jgi:hypothetical protein
MQQIQGEWYWYNRDKKPIPIKTMSTRYLKNCIQFLKRQGYVSSKTVAFYASCPTPTGDGAQDAFFYEQDAVFSAPIDDRIDLLEEELERRQVVTRFANKEICFDD